MKDAEEEEPLVVTGDVDDIMFDDYEYWEVKTCDSQNN